VIATVINVDALLQVAAASLIAGVGLTTSFSFAILGLTRFVDMRRDGRPIEAGVYATVATLGLLVWVGGIVFGVIVMTTK
jgi:hypothetical protein